MTTILPLSDEEKLRWIVADAYSIARRGNPSMGGPLHQDFQAADKILARLCHHGYAVIPPELVHQWLDADGIASVPAVATLAHLRAARGGAS